MKKERQMNKDSLSASNPDILPPPSDNTSLPQDDHTLPPPQDNPLLPSDVSIVPPPSNDYPAQQDVNTSTPSEATT